MRIILILLLIVPLGSFGQDLQILVTDSTTNAPLPFVNVYLKNSGIGASTDMEGSASFEQVNLLENDLIIVSYIGYNKLELAFSKNDVHSTLEIKLVPSDLLLPEVVINYVKPPKPEKIIRKAIKYTDKNYSNHDVIFNALYRETIDEDGTFIQLNEAITKTYYTGYPQKKLDPKIWQDWNYDESYAFELEGSHAFYPLLKDFNTREDQQTVVASRHSQNLSKHGIENTLIGDPLLLFAFDKIKYQYDFINPSILNKYVFKLEQTEDLNNESCYVISFHPKSSERKFRVDQSRKNKSAIYVGRMYITKESYALVKFQYKLAVERDFGFFNVRMPLDYQVEMDYKKQDGFYAIDHIKFTETKRVGKKDNGASILHTATKELYILDLETSDVTPFADSILFKSTTYSAIRHYKKNYNPDFWKTLKLPTHTEFSQKVRLDLELDKPLVEQFNSFKNEKKIALDEPIVFKEYHSFDYHNNSLVDSLHWMASPSYQHKFRTYLLAENRYAKNELVEDKKYQKKLFEQLNTFYPKEIDSLKVIKPGTYFVKEDDQENDIFYLQKDSIEKNKVLNVSAFKSRHPNVFIKHLIPNQSKNLILISYEEVGIIGSFISVLPFGDTNEIVSIPNMYTVQWCTDSAFIYSKTNKLGRADELRYHTIDNKIDSLIYAESDSTFDVEVIKEKEYLFCSIQSKTENEIYWITSTSGIPTLELVRARKDGVINSIRYSDGLYLLVNDENSGSSIECSTFEMPNHPTTRIKSSKDDYIVDFLPLEHGIIAQVYEHSIPKLKYLNTGDNKWKELELDLGIGQYDLVPSQEKINGFIFSFSSPSHPYTTFRYDFTTEKLLEVSKTTLKNKFWHKNISVKRIWAKSSDGVKIPITLVKNRAFSKGQRGLILNVYGAYGGITTPSFDAKEAILLQQGYAIAYAHVRGESILGDNWYKEGRELKKKNSISDYLACAEYLIKKGFTPPTSLIGYGNSAGGIVVAQAVNEKPEIFHTIILDHAYLDVINTMMNETLPLTIDEYKEWGNPQNKEVFDYLMNYSPYQNIKRQKYPNVLFIASYQDYQTPVWQIAKYAAKLRENNLSDTDIILLTDMNSGHIGNTTGKEWIKLFARTYSFVHLKK
ncbi:MAG: protease II [Crocinitomicaceae bacterium]|jgi:protease II